MVMSTDLVKSTKSRKRKFSSNISDPVADLLTRISREIFAENAGGCCMNVPRKASSV